MKPTFPGFIVLLATALMTSAAFAADPLQLHLRSRAKGPPGTQATVVERQVAWDAKKTALIICDMWDDHWCKSAARRVDEMARPLNEVVKAARTRGIFIIHAPSTCTDFYKNTPLRKRAQSAPFSPTPIQIGRAHV